MTNEIIIGKMSGKKVAAIKENGNLVEFIIDGGTEVAVGNIYLARITDVMKHMNTCFADIGNDQMVYLQSDVAQYKQGNVVLLQIKKEAYSTKYATATDKISITGRYVVIFQGSNHIGVSRKIQDKDEYKRLFHIGKKHKPKDMGLIIRTSADGVDENDISKEIVMISNKLNELINCSMSEGPARPLYIEKMFPDIILRDRVDSSIDSIVIEGTELYDEFYECLRNHERTDVSKLKLYSGDFDFFTVYDVTPQLKHALSRKVWLPSGGFIIFDKTEAMTVIDVNTGKYAGAKDVSESILKVNLEAATEIARQIRIRNIGGIIIVDFIDMNNSSDNEHLLDHFENEVSSDKKRTNILGMTKLGLVEMTRKRTGEGLYETLKKSEIAENI